MTYVLSQETLGWFFGLAPLVIGLAIYMVAWATTRREVALVPPMGQTFACANCGRRSVREHMVPQMHDGAVSYVCAHCAGTH